MLHLKIREFFNFNDKNHDKKRDLNHDFYQIDKNLTRIIEIISILSDIRMLESKSMNLNIISCSIEDILEKAVKSVSLALNKNEPEILKPCFRAKVNCDPTVVYRVLTHLIKNGIEHNSGSRPVQISLELIKDFQTNPELKVLVRDFGPGIQNSENRDIFSKFISIEDTMRGSVDSAGLGLPFSKAAINAMNGNMGYSNHKTSGCVFWFTLPAVECS
jgi:K+-sensing histidine kinase KdpD